MNDKTAINTRSPGTWTMAWRNIGRRPRRSILSASAVAIASLIGVFMMALLDGMNRDMESNIQRYLTGQIQIQHKGLEKAALNAMALYVPNFGELRTRLETVSYVQAIAPRIVSAASVFVDDEAVYFPFTGMDFSADPMQLGALLSPGGKLPRPGEREALISIGLADKLGLNVGDSLTALTQTLRGSSNGMSFTVTGIVRPSLGEFAAPNMFLDFSTAQRFVRLTDGAMSVLIVTRPGYDIGETRDGAQYVLDSAGLTDYRAVPWYQASTTLALMGMAGVSYGSISFIFFCLASTVIINTMLMIVFERTREIGTLNAIGMESGAVQRLFIAESAVLSGLGAVAGALAGSIVSIVGGIVGLDFSESLKNIDLNVSSVLHPSLSWYAPLVVVAGATAVATLFTLIPLARIRSLKIVDALRGEQ